MNIALSCVTLMVLLSTACFADRNLPVDNGRTTSGVGYRLDPFGSGRVVYHRGYDIAVPVGTPVRPTRAGTVYYAGPHRGYGNLVAVEHGNGQMSIYGHNSTLKVKSGQRVDSRTVLALSGNTGRSTGPHVHYELRPAAEFRNPRNQRQRYQPRNELIYYVADPPELAGGIVNGQGGDDPEMSLRLEFEQ